MWMHCFQHSSTGASHSVLRGGGGNACGRICFGVEQQHGPAPDSQQRHPVPCDALLDSEGALLKDNLSVMLIVCLS